MFRPIRPEDEAIFLQFSEQFYHSPAVLHPIPASYHRATFEELMRSDTYLSCYLFEVNGQPVGYALTNRTFSTKPEAPCSGWKSCICCRTIVPAVWAVPCLPIWSKIAAPPNPV